MAGTTSGDAGPIAAGTTVREAVSRYPGIEDVFERHGIQGCGGPQGPIEPIGFFARVHNVEPEALLRELNDYVRGRAGQALPATAAGAPQAEQSFYFLPIATAVFLALLAGLPLGIVAALGVAHDIGVASRWTQLVQAHGHLQVVAWVGLFILGIAYHVLPRFKGVPLWPERLVLPSFFLLLAGVVLRTVSQPWADAAGPAGLLAASAVLELAGALAFATVVAGTLVTLDAAALSALGQTLAVQPGAVSKTLVAALLTAGGQALAVQPGAVSKALLAASLAAAGQTLSVQPGAVSRTLSAAALLAAGQALSVQPGAVSKALSAALLLAAGQNITVSAPFPGATVTLNVALLTAGGQVLDVQPGAVSVALLVAAIILQGQTLTILGGTFPGQIVLVEALLYEAGLGEGLLYELDLAETRLFGAGLTE